MKLSTGTLSLLSMTLSLAQAAHALKSLPQSVGILLYPGITNLDVAGPLSYWNGLPDHYNISVHFISDSIYNQTHPVVTENGTVSRGEPLVPTHTYATAPKLDILHIPGGFGTRDLINNTAILDFINTRYHELQYLFVVCTGGAFVAKTGIYDGKYATTNKAAWKFVTAQGPKVHWVAQARWVVDGHIWSSSGVEAGTDMANAFVGHVWGDKVASTISDAIEYTPITNSSYDPFTEIWNVTGTANATYPPSPVHPPVPPTTHNSTTPRNWAVVLYPGITFLDLISIAEYIPFVPVSSYSLIAETLDPVGLTSRPNSSVPNGLKVMPNHTFANPPHDIDVLVIPGRNTLNGSVSPAVTNFIRDTYPKVKHVISVGTGSYLLAESGVLNGKKATTSKSMFKDIVQRTHQDNVTWTTGRWVRDGNIWTASGTAAGLDATYALVVDLYGFDASQESWKIMEYVPNQNATYDPFAAKFGVH